MKELPENPFKLLSLYDRSDAMTQRAMVLGLAVERANKEPLKMGWGSIITAAILSMTAGLVILAYEIHLVNHG